MLEVILSQDYEIVIPEEVRDSLQLKAGQRFSLVTKGNSISLIPQKISIESFRGVLKGADISNIRNRDERI